MNDLARKLSTATLLGSLAAGGCIGTEVGNPADGEVEVHFTVQKPETNPQALTLSTGVEIDEAWLVLESIELRQADTCEDEGEVDLEQPHVVELVTGRELPPIRIVDAATRYCRIDIEVGGADAAELAEEADPSIAGSSVLVRGATPDGVPFELRSDIEERLRLEGDFTLREGRNSLLVAFALDQWVTPELLAGAEGEDMIRIDEDNNADILEAFHETLEESVELFEDRNEDGILDEQDVRTTSSESD